VTFRDSLKEKTKPHTDALIFNIIIIKQVLIATQISWIHVIQYLIMNRLKRHRVFTHVNSEH